MKTLCVQTARYGVAVHPALEEAKALLESDLKEVSQTANAAVSAQHSPLERRLHGQDTPHSFSFASLYCVFLSAPFQDQPVDEVLGAHVKALWADPAIQETFSHSAEYQLNDSSAYFFNQIDTIATLGYVPSEQDVLHARAPTTGIVENSFEIDGNNFKMFDVRGAET